MTRGTEGEAPTPSGRAAAAASLFPTAVVLVAMVAAVAIMLAGHWTPVGDNGLITAYSLDVPSDLPLVGMPSTLSAYSDRPASQPGPLPFWLLAPTTHLFGAPGGGVAVGTLLIDATLVGIIAWCARRLDATARWLLVAATPVVILTGLGADGITAPFNPNFVVLGTMAALVALWVVLAGDPRGLPWFVAAASIAAQAHVSALLLVGTLVVVAVAVAVRDVRQGGPRARVITRRALPLATIVGLIAWSGPIVDQVAGTGNLWTLATASGSTGGAGTKVGLERLIGAAGVPPWWLTERVGQTFPAPGAVQIVTGVVVLGWLLWCGWRACQTRDRRTVGAVVMLIAASIAAVETSARVPAEGFGANAPANMAIWWPISALIWVVGIRSAIEVVRARRHQRDRVRRPWRGAALPAAASVVALVAAALLVADARPAESTASIQFGQARVVGDAVDAALPPGSVVLIDSGSDTPEELSAAQFLVPQLRLRGHDVQVRFQDFFGYWDHHRRSHPIAGDPDAVLVIVEVGKSVVDLPDGFRLVARYDPAEPPPAFSELRRKGLRGSGDAVMTYWLMVAS
ncbi:MAG: hypothetical protein KF906_11580 [Actinobacteria bacterium]|nr:hypothetical protein [Actinomycetota bacterium]